MKKILYSILLAFFWVSAIAQNTGSDVFKSLEKWAAIFPQEKAYLHTDKPYYVVGDTIWLKAYVVVGSRNHLSAVSGAIYVDLITDTDSLVNTLKLPLINGLGKGNINLVGNLPEGNYRLRAYTQWMRNAGPDYFFDKTFVVGRVLSESKMTTATILTTEANGKVKVEIKYIDALGVPIALKEVKYLWSNGNSENAKYLKTDKNGFITLTERFDAKELQKNIYLETRIEAEKGKYLYKNIPLKLLTEEVDIQFFPEGGVLVSGAKTRVAFKATNTNGLGLTVKGKVVDGENNTICEFESAHLGMGSFFMSAESGKKYDAIVELPDGKIKKIALPQVSDKELSLAVYSNYGSDTLLVRIFAPKAVYSQNKEFHLSLMRAEELLVASPVKITKAVTSIRIPIADFPTGIIQATLFDGAGEPLNERIYFQYKKGVELGLQNDKKVYKTKEKVDLRLQATNESGGPVVGNFSVAVVNEDQVPINEESEISILSQLLLSSDLKGYVEKPNAYFLTQNQEEAAERLDLLMLTQGYRRFVWKEVLDGKIRTPTYPFEKLTSRITGRMMNFGNKPIVDGKVSLSSLGAGLKKDVVTDASGQFDFGDILLLDSVKFTISGAKSNNNKRVEIVLDKVAPIRVTANKNVPDLVMNVQDTLKKYLEETKVSHSVMKKMGLGQAFELDEVEIKAKGKSRVTGTSSHNLNAGGRADQTIKGSDMDGCPTLRMCLEGRLVGVIFKLKELPNAGMVNLPFSTRSAKSESPMLVVVNGRNLNPNDGSDAMDIADIFDGSMIPPSEIESIEVLRTPSTTGVYGNAGMNGVIIINARNWTPTAAKNYSVFYAPKGFNKVRDFYAPRYDGPVAPVIDERSTIYWNPSILTDKEGKASFDFFNAPKPGTYRVVVEGIDVSGNLGRYIYRYKVQ